MLAPNVVSLPSLISWLRTKDPEETYDYSSHTTCCFAQYLAHHGYPSWSSPERFKLFEQLHDRYMDVANPIRGLGPQPHEEARAVRLGWTFGKALERALQMQENPDGH